MLVLYPIKLTACMKNNFKALWLNIVNAYPDKQAIVADNNTITYQQLHQRAIIFARAQIEKPQARCIQITTNNAIEHVVLIFGILLSGNFYYSCTSENKINVDSLNTTTENPFCLFSTSGSLGEPKQLIHTHDSILEDTLRIITDKSITFYDNIDLLFSLEFSASLACIFPALLTGATLFIYNLKQEGILTLPAFWIKNNITISNLSVSTFRALLKDTQDLNIISQLRSITISAEPVYEADIRNFQKRFSNKTLLQVAYATTETRTISEHKIATDTLFSNNLLSVGKPVKGRTVFIKSNDGIVLPIGETGEIFVEADYIPSFYSNKANLDLPAHSTLCNGRISFATGDLGCFNQEGYLFWCGRKDSIIKINGQKVSLFQIEMVIANNPNIITAIALNQQNQIKVFLETTPDFNLSILKQNLYKSLPFIMLPTRYVILDKLPRTKTGKIDRFAIAQLQMNGAGIDNTGNAQSKKMISTATSFDKDKLPDKENKIIALIKSIWKKELNYTLPISDDDDFFLDLGGDSLIAEFCLVQIEKEMQIKMATYTIFAYTTASTLANFLEGKSAPLVKAVKMNQQLPLRKSIYFIPPMFDNSNDYKIIAEKLSPYFNLIFIQYSPYDKGANLVPLSVIADQISLIITTPSTSLLFGYSFGGLLSYYLTEAIEKKYTGQTISCLVLLDTPFYNKNTLTNRIIYVIKDLNSRKLWKPYLHSKKASLILLIKTKRFKNFILKLGFYPNKKCNQLSETNVVSTSLFYNTVMAYVKSGAGVSLEKKIASPILFFKTTVDVFGHRIRNEYNWQDCTTGKFTKQVLDCMHIEILIKDNQLIADLLRLYCDLDSL